jgi:hypothetical protein
VARFVDAYRSLPPNQEPHDCKKRGCVYVITSKETTPNVVASELVPDAVSAYSGLGRLPISKRAGAVGGKERRADRVVDRLRDMREEFAPAGRLMVYPS